MSLRFVMPVPVLLYFLVKKYDCRRKRLSIPHIPEDVIIEILSRLPVKSLLRFTSVCRAWRNLIQNNRNFVSQHLKHSSKAGNLLILTQNSNPNIDTHLDVFADKVDGGNFSSPIDRVNVRSSIGLTGYMDLYLSNGLTCVDAADQSPNQQGYMQIQSKYGFIYVDQSAKQPAYIVWNPATRQFKVIPKSVNYKLHARHNNSCFEFFGFGFVPETLDYKLVVIQVCIVNDMLRLLVEVYSKSTGDWREIDATSFPTYQSSMVKGLRPHILLKESYTCLQSKGVCYWLSMDQKNDPNAAIIGFDLRNQVFLHLKCPDSNGYYIKMCRLAEISGRLALIYNLQDGPHSFLATWIMNEHEQGWTGKYTVKLSHDKMDFGCWKECLFMLRFYPRFYPKPIGHDRLIIERRRADSGGSESSNVKQIMNLSIPIDYRYHVRLHDSVESSFTAGIQAHNYVESLISV